MQRCRKATCSHQSLAGQRVWGALAGDRQRQPPFVSPRLVSSVNIPNVIFPPLVYFFVFVLRIDSNPRAFLSGSTKLESYHPLLCCKKRSIGFRGRRPKKGSRGCLAGSSRRSMPQLSYRFRILVSQDDERWHETWSSTWKLLRNTRSILSCWSSDRASFKVLSPRPWRVDDAEGTVVHGVWNLSSAGVSGREATEP